MDLCVCTCTSREFSVQKGKRDQWQGEQGTCGKLIAKPTTPMPSFLQPTRQFSWDWSKEKKKIQKTALAWWQEQHSCDARVPSGNKERTRLEHRLANTLHRQPQRPSQGPCARGNALARKHGDSALQIHLHNSASGKGKKNK